MPIIIRELVLTMTVGPQAQSADVTTSPGAGQGQGQQQVVAECVAQVLAILSEKAER